jgi:NAD(P)-dependent dehydrogenase (short-subunit alcohol dehydrogenase family)
VRGLKGKGVLVSGGSSGIGRAAARRFLEEGSAVFLCGLETAAVEETVRELADLGRVAGTACDVASENAVHRFVDEAERHLGAIDILINNAGIAWQEAFLDITAEHWDQILATNLRGMFLVAQAVARRMVAQRRRGSIVNMSSTNGLAAEADYAHYNASKGGVLLLTKTMAVELGKHGIRVNALCPGKIRTPLSDAIEDPAAVARFEREMIPLGRSGTPDEVAAAYAFLASDDASFIHGEALVIDGGQLAL